MIDRLVSARRWTALVAAAALFTGSALAQTPGAVPADAPDAAKRDVAGKAAEPADSDATAPTDEGSGEVPSDDADEADAKSAGTTATGAAGTTAKGPADTTAKGPADTTAKGAAGGADAGAATDKDDEGEGADDPTGGVGLAARIASLRNAATAPADPADDLAAEVEAYVGEQQVFREDTTRLLRHSYERRRRDVQTRYRGVVDGLAVEERSRRMDAIERFEAFLARYPDHPKYTPDALFRLAELHFEASNERYVAALEDADRQMAAFDRGELAEMPGQPKQDYTRSIELFDRLIRSWPKYRNLDGAIYLKGYCLLEMEQPDLALAQFEDLVKRYPESRFAPETWTRIGEHYFDHNDLERAIEAYTKVLSFGQTNYYDKALYKLAWTHYRADRFVDAIAQFRALIEYSDEQARKTGRAGSDLRSEAIQYLAISLQEDDWDGDQVPDQGAGITRVLTYVKGDKPYDVEILRAVADIMFDNAKYQDTIETTRYLLEKFPTHPENPELHARMITALERLQRIDEAFTERGKLSATYAEGSAWYEANRNDPKVIAAAEELVEDSLIQAATYHHSQAQQLKQRLGEDPSLEAQAIREYKAAAEAYERYLARYPKSPNAYDLNFFYAECLYYSFRFGDAAGQYAKVRDIESNTKYQEPSGFSAILSRQNEVKGLVLDGKIDRRASLLDEALKPVEEAPTDADNPEKKVIEPIPIPDPVQALIGERVAYVEKKLDSSEDAGRQARVIYKIGEVYFDYQHFDEARLWFKRLIETHPQTDVAGFAARNIMETYRRTNDWEQMAKWADSMAEAGLGRQFDEEIRTLKVGALFKSAEELFAKGKYEEAGAEYVRLLEENPGNQFADAALNNAAVAYEKTRRFESATRMYQRVVDEHPKSKFAESALFRVGVNAERFYDFDRAVAAMLKLVDKYPDSPNRADALYQAALLQERTQNYREAARQYERYVSLFPDRKDTAETFYRAARNYEKLKDQKNELRIYAEFERRYGRDPAQNSRVVEGLAKTALIHQKANRKGAARRTWEQVITEFNRRGMAPGTFEANYPARAQFELVELDFEKYQAVKVTGALPNQANAIKELKRRLPKLDARYNEVLQYKSFDWNLAALYRMGQLFQLFAQNLYDAPIPGSFSAEEEDIYRTQLEDIAVPLEDAAVKKYEFAYEKAREFRVTNEWTKRILESLNKYKPSDYPLFKEERRMVSRRPLTPPRLLTGAPPPTPPPGDASASEPTSAPGATGSENR